MTAARGTQSPAYAPGAAPPAPPALPLLWVNGQPVDASGPHLSAFDRGSTLADGVFETVRVYRGAAFRLEQHLARLSRALATLAIPVPHELRDSVAAALRAGAGTDAALRITVTRGAGGGVAPPAPPSGAPTVIVALQALPTFSPRVYQHGLSAHVATGRRNERAMTAGLKTLAYTDAVAAMIEAARAGADEALFLDTRERCSEAAASNLFAWIGDELRTPPVSCGALPGITRAAVLELAAALEIPVAEREFGLDELLGADEAFLTSSLRELAPLVRIGGRAVGAGEPGPVTRRLADAYAALVARECAW